MDTIKKLYKRKSRNQFSEQPLQGGEVNMTSFHINDSVKKFEKNFKSLQTWPFKL
jgi:hypothetical protein